MFNAVANTESSMPHLRRLVRVQTLFAGNDGSGEAGTIIRWWEWRRIPYNLILLVLGIASIYIYWSLFDKYAADPSDDGIFPGLMPFVVGIMANIFYTAGWIVELLLCLLRREGDKRIGPAFFAMGLGFSILVVSLPAISALLLTASMHQNHATHWP